MTDEDPRGALFYDAAIRSLDQQASVVESVYMRTGILLSAASIVTGFLASAALVKDGSLSGWGWAATGAFLGVGGLCVWLLLPSAEWWSGFDVRRFNTLSGHPVSHPPISHYLCKNPWILGRGPQITQDSRLALRG
jgi:hypothetical protein